MCVCSCNTFASANVGPPHRLEEDGDATFLIPIKRSDIEVVAETLAYVFDNPDGTELFGHVTADYKMHNNLDDEVTVLAAFVSNNPVIPLEILFKSEPVQILRTEKIDWGQYTFKPRYIGETIERDWNKIGYWTNYGIWQPTFEEIMFYFSTGGASDDFNPAGNYRLEVTLFEMTFEADEICDLSVSYTEKGAYFTDRSGYFRITNHRFEFYYFLEPAQYWAGFKDLTINISVNKKAAVEFSLDGFVNENGKYSAHFDTLPDRNLHILVYKMPYNYTRLIVSSAVLICLIILFAFLLRRRKNRHCNTKNRESV